MSSDAGTPSPSGADAGSGPAPLGPAQVYRRCDPATVPFDTTAEWTGDTHGLGQARALEALQLGLSLRREGYNVFALGPDGVGKHALVRRLVQARAAEEPTGSDWCYVHNFADPRRPRALSLPAGRAAPLAEDLRWLVRELRVAIPAVFQTDDYRARRKLVVDDLARRQEAALEGFRQEAAAEGVALLRTQMGMGLAPTRDGEVLDPEQFERLPPEERDRLRGRMRDLQDKLEVLLAEVPRWQREHRERLRELDRELVGRTVSHLIDELRKRHADLPAVVEHLGAVQEDVVDSVGDFLPAGDEGERRLPEKSERQERQFARYRVNVLVDRTGSQGAPVLYEDNPTHAALVGRAEHRAEQGALITDFDLIKPGALHRANGGYLVLDARKVLTHPLAWEALKRALRAHEVRIESIADALALVSTVTLDPERIPLEVKVILIGDRWLYQLLAAHDPDFLDLFRVAADFEEDLVRDQDGERRYATLVASLARQDGVRPLGRPAVARLVEFASRVAGDSARLSTRVEGLIEVMHEADHRAGLLGRGLVEAADVEEALAARRRRSSRVPERLREAVLRGTLRVETSGARVGQVNGLTVVQLGHEAFGHPARISARVRPGPGRVVDIEREVALGGPIHSKGVLILSGFLGARYCPERPLSLAATLVFEQSYGGVEGDSASAAELCALVSALAEAALRQEVAITGSVDQHGRIQAVGGLNEKIEGFFDVCAARGLSGSEGVLLPSANVVHLMLRPDVVEAVAAGRFRIWPIDTVDEALLLLTGRPAGERDPATGRFPEGSINAAAEARLLAFAEAARSFGRRNGESS